MARFDDTIVALSSGRPPAAVAIVRVSGPRAHDAAMQLAGPLPPPRKAVLRELRDPSGHGLIDHALLLRFDSPASATGENIAEFQCHGGRAVIDAMLDALTGIDGVRLAEPGEFTRRALANGRIDLTEAEGLADLLAAETQWQRRSALVRAGGGLRHRLDDWRDRLLGLAARAEVAIDYSDEEDGAAGDDLAPDILVLAGEFRLLLDSPKVEPLREGVRVAVGGPPNAGKSSLVNALAQADKVIVTDIPGTTRDVIEIPLSIAGIPFVLVDTAGLRDSDDRIETIGVDRARREQTSADILLWLGDPASRPAHRASIQLSPKADLGGHQEGLPVSVVTGDGIASLATLLVETASGLLPAEDQLALDRRQFELLEQAYDALERSAELNDHVLVAEELRTALAAIDRISGRAGIEELLDQLFSRFCLGK